MASTLKIGTTVRTLCQKSETAKVVRPRKANLPLPGPNWFIVQFDVDGLRLCVHRDALAVANAA